MKKKNLIILIAGLFLALASCDKKPDEIINNIKDRGTVDNTLPDIEIPDVLKPETIITDASYVVKHMLEKEDGTYEVREIENLKGTIGDLTKALAKDYPGYVLSDFSQALIKEDSSTVIELKYKANKYNLSLNEIENNKGIISGSGEYYSYDNKVTLIAKPNIGYEFVGWFNGDEKLSENKTYTFEIENDLEINAQFEMKEEFKLFDFSSDQSSCVIKGIKGELPSDLIIPENVTEIDDEVFKNTKLNSVILPKSLNKIGDNAFENSTILSITLNSSPLIGSYAFGGCNNLFEIYYTDPLNSLNLSIKSSNNGYVAYNAMVIHESIDELSIYKQVDDFLFGVIDGDACLISYNGNDEEIKLPEEFTYDDELITSYEIGIGAFRGNSDVNVLIIPSSVTNIGANAFYGCTNLFEIYNLSDLNIIAGDNSNGSVGSNAVVIHDSIDEERSVFETDNYKYVIFEKNDEKFAKIVSYNVTDADLIINQIDNYKTIIGKGVFKDYDLIENVTLGENVIGIEEYAFTTCQGLKTVIANDVLYVDEGAFKNCPNLEKVSLNNCKTIDSSAFSANYRLNNVNIPKVETINNYAFYCCYSLYQIILPETLNSIGNYAFQNCYKLKNVVNKSNLYIYTGYSSNGYVGYYANEITTKDATTVQIQKDTTYIIEATDTSYLNSLLIKYEDVLDAYYFDGTTSNYSANHVYKLTEQVNGTSKKLGDLTIDGTSGELNPTGSYSQMNAGCKISFTATNDGQFVITSNISYHNYTIKSGEEEAVPATIDSYYTNENGYITYNNGEKTLIAYIGNEKELIVPSDVTKIDQGAFAYGDYTKITIPSNATLSSSIFYNCNNLEVLDLPCNNLEDIFDALYYYSSASTPTNLKTLRLSGENISINSYDLEKMTNLENLIIAGEFSTYFNVFSNNSYLKNFYFEGTLKEWTSISFDSEGENVSPMTQASNFYLLDEEGETEILNKKFKLLDELTIPSDITSIGDNQFNGFGIKKLTIPDTLINIGEYAFANCNELVEVNLNKRKVIDTGMFTGCTKLQTINLPKELTTIEDYAFAGCNNLKKISLNNISEIGEYAFSGCSSLNNVIIPSSVTIIKEGVFNSCYGLQKVVLPELTKNDEDIIVVNGITDIYDEAFANCYVLNSINLPSTLTTIGESAFKNCEALRSVSIKDTSITVIPAYLFSGCRNLSNFEVNNSIVDVGDHAFDNCKKLVFNHADGGNYLGPEDEPYKWFIKADSDAEDIVIKDECEIILDSAFVKAKELKSLVIPNTITKLGQILKGNNTIEYLEMPFLGNGVDYAFINYTFGDTVNYYSSVPSSLKTLKLTGSFDSIETKAFYNASSISTIILPDTVKYINNYAFEGCGITSFDSKNIETIGDYAFNKSKLTNVILRNKVSKIGDYAFQNCSNLLSADLGEINNECVISNYIFKECSLLNNISLGNVRSIGSYMFYNCSSLENVIIPDTCIYIGSYAFSKSGIKDFKASSTLNTIYEYAFSESNIEIADLSTMASDSTIGNYLFYKCSKLDAAILPDIETIPYSLFEECSKLVNFELPQSVTNINSKAFYQSGIKKIVLPAALTKANGASYEFSYSALEEVIINSSAETYLSVNAFTGCSNIKKVTFNEGVTNVSQAIFDGCSNLKDANLASTITKIGASAFNKCSSLCSITIPQNVSEIGDNAFDNCNKLLEIYNLSSLEFEIGSESYGKIALNAMVIHTSLEEESMYSKDDNGLIFIIKDDKLYLYGYEGVAEEITLPSSVTKNGITYDKYDIHDGAFKNNETIKKIIIPSNVDVIGKEAFYNCINLTDVVIEEGLKIIESKAFDNCKNLINITIPNSLEKILGESVFNNCNSLKYNLSEAGDKYLGNNDNPYVVLANARATSIPTLNVLEGCRIIAPYACASIAYYEDCAVTLPIGLLYIGDYGFYSCMELKNIEFPNSLEGIGNYAFGDAYEFKNIILENTNLKSIGDSAFSLSIKGNIEKVTLPNTLKTIGEWCFKNNNIKDIHIPSSVEYIAFNAFYNCTSLENVRISSPKIIFGESVFNNDESIVNVYYDLTIEDWMNMEFENSYSTPMYYASNFYLMDNNGDVTYNDKNYSLLLELNISSQKINKYSFYGFKNLNTIILNDIEMVGEEAFNNCNNVVNLAIPSTLTYVDKSGFYYMQKLENIYFGGNVDDWCRIEFVNEYSNPLLIPNYSSINKYLYLLDSDGDVSYNGNNYKLIEDITISNTIDKIYNFAFYDCQTIKNVKILGDLEYIGKNSFYKSSLISIEINSVKLIEEYAFRECPMLRSVKIGEGECEIGQYVFYNDSLLDELILSEGLKKIGSGSFNGCRALYTLTIPSTVTTIDSYAFQDCTKLYEVYNLSNINISKGSSYPGGYAGYYAKVINKSATSKSIYTTDSNGFVFLNYNGESYLVAYVGNETDLVLPESYEFDGNTITSYDITDYAFSYRTDIRSVIIPSAVKIIKTYAFAFCPNIKYVVIPNTITEIKNAAFYNNPSTLIKVYYEGTATEWSNVSSKIDNSIKNKTIYYYSETKPTSGKYWHYVDGKPLIWN